MDLLHCLQIKYLQLIRVRNKPTLLPTLFLNPLYFSLFSQGVLAKTGGQKFSKIYERQDKGYILHYKYIYTIPIKTKIRHYT